MSMSKDPLSFYLDKANPDVWKTVVKFAGTISKAAKDAGLNEKLVELVNIRVSQINGCAFCLDLHYKAAIQAGVTDQQMALLPAWQDAPDVFTPQEQAALQLAESVTELGTLDNIHTAQIMSSDELTDEQYAAVQWVAIAMNTTNRISIMSHHPVRPAKTK